MVTIPLTDPRARNISIAGGKGANLSQLLEWGIPVPPGFIVTAPAFEKFHGQHPLPSECSDAIMASYNMMGALLVAVRSSAIMEDSTNTSWAGELETYLNTDQEHLIENIQRCWASRKSARAQAYAATHSVNSLSMAVVVQQMIPSEISGVAFTVHPVTEDPNQLVIEAGWGLGEAIVSGAVTPDCYTLNKKERHVIETTVNEQEQKLEYSAKTKSNEWIPVSASQKKSQKLTGSEILQLAELCITIEDRSVFPCDIEWAMIRNQSSEISDQNHAPAKFYITQSRPITTLHQ